MGGLLLAAIGALLIVMGFNRSWETVWNELTQKTVKK